MICTIFKRKQRIIPVLERNENTSFKFISTIGRLYFLQNDHKKLCQQKMKLFYAYIRDRYNINTTKVDEGYFATLFSDQKKSASFQTLDGTASVFKSISGWQDKKFYILTNEIPIGTIVKITTADFKTICAKVINALPDVSNSIQYRLSDAAAAILGITNKTFQITVTY